MGESGRAVSRAELALEASLQEAIGRLPRVELAALPTPLQELPRLSAAIGGPRICMKRDDLTEMALSGNKTRMLEFELAYAIAQKADAVVGANYVNSNTLRQMLLACNRVGLEAYGILVRELGQTLDYNSLEVQGNLLLQLLGGAHLEVVEVTAHEGHGSPVAVWGQLAAAKAAQLSQEGRRPYILRGSEASRAVAAVGYVDCALELHRQLRQQDLSPDYVILASSGVTQAGLLVGSAYLRDSYKVISFPYRRPRAGQTDEILSLAHRIARLLALPIKIERSAVVTDGRYSLDRFGTCDDSTIQGMMLLARTEGIMLDPLYTGRVLVGLRHYVEEGTLTERDTVLFIHTGGFPLLFNYGPLLAKRLGEQLERGDPGRDAPRSAFKKEEVQ